MAWRKSFNNDVADWDQVDFDPAEWLAPFRRVLKPTGTVFAFTSYNLLGRWHEAFDPRSTRSSSSSGTRRTRRRSSAAPAS